MSFQHLKPNQLIEITETFFYHNGFDDCPVRDEEDEDNQTYDEAEPFDFIAEYDGTERNPNLINMQASQLHPQIQNQVQRPSSSLPTLPRTRGRRANSASQRVQSQISVTSLYEKAREKAKRRVQSRNDADLGASLHSWKRSRFGIGARMRRDRDENEDQNQGMRVEGSSSGVQSKENQRELQSECGSESRDCTVHRASHVVSFSSLSSFSLFSLFRTE